MREFLLQPGVTLLKIHGVCLLAADRTARKHCPFVRQVNEIGAFIWEQLEKGADRPAIMDLLRQEFDIPKDCDPEADLDAFLRSLEDNHYLICEAKDYEV